MLLNLDPFNPKIQELAPNIHDLCRTIASDFYIHTRDPFDYEVKSVHLLRNPVVWRRYQSEKKLRRSLAQDKARAQAKSKAVATVAAAQSAGFSTWSTEQFQGSTGMIDPELLFRDEVLFHGTQKHKLPSILLNGLDPKMTVRANYGKGCYFSDSIEKCMQYVDVQKSMEQEYSIILCCVLLGNVLVEPHERGKRKLNAQTMFLPDGYDSATATNKPESHYRLSQFSVLFKAGSYPLSFIDIPRTCTVPAPVDNNKELQGYSQQKSLQWREPDGQQIKMFRNIFNLQNFKVCNIHFPTWKEWAIAVTNPTGEERFGYLRDTDMSALIQMSKNIELLQERMETDKTRTLADRKPHLLYLQILISKVSHGEQVLDLLSNVNQLQEQIQAIEQQHVSISQSLIQAGALHPMRVPSIQTQLMSLQEQSRQLLELLSTLSATDHMAAMCALNAREELRKKMQDDNERHERQVNAINTERARCYKIGVEWVKDISGEDLEQRFVTAKEQREIASASQGLKEDFQMVNTQVTTSTTKSWALIVAEMLLPHLMILQLPYDKQLLLSLTKPTANQKSGQDWWSVPPQTIFQEPAPSHLFWPLDPRRRVPNRRFLRFKDYIEWIFFERENRIRKRNWRLNQTAPQAQLKPPADMLQDDDLRQYLQDQWDLLDPTIARSIGDLSSRHGTVVFNREERQEELDQMGADLLNELFVQAELHISIGGTSSHPGASAQSEADCPICRDPLEVTDPNKQSTSNAESDKAVRLKSCRHCFHDSCIKQWFQSKDAQLKCPMCNTMCTTVAKAGATKNAMNGQRPQKLGPMPDGVMGYHFDIRLSCYFIYVTIPAHKIPNPDPSASSPTIQIPADVRYAIVPVSARLGPLLMIRLITTFYYGHLFRVGHSLTRGVDNVVVWNGVHLRTSMTGQFGFPAPNFERNCWEEINQKGVAMGLDELVLSLPRADGSEPASTPLDGQFASRMISLPAAILEEMAGQALAMRLFHRDQPLLFSD
ncbi:putative E3 ubiquitin-protein ligase dtx2 [Modicella reniformis]|uniref:RING-type E3 ubiquitin transferase n=1 Tax=Modicella reniformis TaxID=1440133 RepID=A0A9P6LS86_9FUNG|nr:putative E3 ubiquitin-protein ligase dtx2 [Modicella reniformis]